MSVKTVTICDPNTPGDYIIINEDRFDPKIHTIFDAPKHATGTPAPQAQPEALKSDQTLEKKEIEGHWFVVLGETIVSGPYSGEEIDAALTREIELAAKPKE